MPTQGLRVRSPLTPTKITKSRYVLVLSRKHAPVYQCFTLGTLEPGLSCVWWALQYLALWATNRNYLYAAKPNGQSPSASLNKSNTPSKALSWVKYQSTRRTLAAPEMGHEPRTPRFHVRWTTDCANRWHITY